MWVELQMRGVQEQQWGVGGILGGERGEQEHSKEGEEDGGDLNLI